MQRRDFLRAALAGGTLYASGAAPFLGNVAHASGFPLLDRRVLVNVTLDGGPDFRFLLPPAYQADTASFGHKYWEATAAAHGLGASAAAWESRWNNDYTAAEDEQFDFGILNECGWLQRMWSAGNVAIVCNVHGSETRDHPHSLLVLDQGDRATGRNDFNRPGWGGRLAVASGGNAMSLTPLPSPFCFSPAAGDPDRYDNQAVIAASNTREFALFDAPEGASAEEMLITRSLRAYYEAKRLDLPADSVYRRFLDHEEKLRAFGNPVDERLADVPLPASIAALYDSASPTLFDPSFGEQIRNLHDSYACSDIFDLRVASLKYKGFDTHDNQLAELAPRFGDLFGDGKAMDTLQQELPADTWAQSVFLFGGEFGRQIKANGDGGTDHGRGNIMLLVGESVRGGVYGDMFPQQELATLADASPDIEGRTALEHIFGALCDWIEPGSGANIFPALESAPLETGVSPAGLFL